MNQSEIEKSRRLFEKHHCGNNPHVIRRNSTDDSYVLPSVQDAYAGWCSAMQYTEQVAGYVLLQGDVNDD